MNALDSTISAIRINHRMLTLKQLLQRLRINAALASIDLCKEELAVECWADTLKLAASGIEQQAALTRFRRANGLHTISQTTEWLRSLDMTLDELIAILRPQALRAILARHVVTADEIRQQFLEAAQQYDRAEISLIVTAEYGVAQELRFRIEEGSDYHSLARLYSADSATAKAGGYAGLFSRGDLEPETAAAVFGAVSGTVLGPFERKRGYILIRVEGLYPAELNEAVESDIREQLFRLKLDSYMDTLDIREDLWTLRKE